MKNFYILIATLLFATIDAQIIDIPDPVFKNKLLQSSTSYSVATTSTGAYIDVDVNNDGEIEVSEVQNIYMLILVNQGISNLEGIQYFSNLYDLRCHDNQLTTLEVSGLSNLNILNCSANDLTSINFEGTHLVQFNCSYNQLSTLDFASLQYVSYLDFSSNYFTSLSLSSELLPVINMLVCNLNLISSINITNQSLYGLHCPGNLLTELDTSGLPGLSNLSCGMNQITSLDLSGSPFIQIVDCHNNQLSTLNLNSASNLNTLRCQNNPLLTSIYIKNGQNENTLLLNNLPSLTYMCVDESQLTAVQTILTQNGNSAVLDSNCSLGTNNVTSSDSSVYPNPAETILHVGNQQIPGKIYNILGQMVMEVGDISAINVDGLTAGIYFVRFNERMIKFLKQ